MEPKIPLFSVSQNWKKIFSNESFRSLYIDAALQRCSYEKVLWKYAKNLQENNPCRSAFWIKLQSNFIEIKLRHGYSPVNLLSDFRTPLTKNNSVGLLLLYTGITSISCRAKLIKKTKVCKSSCFKNFSKFTEKHVCQSLLFNKVFKNTFFIEHYRWLLLSLWITKKEHSCSKSITWTTFH